MLSRFPRLRLFLILLFSFWLALLALRAGFYDYFLSDSNAPAADLWKAFGMGARFDLRIVLLMLLPLGVMVLLPGRFGLRGKLARGLAKVVTSVLAVALLFIYIVDFGHYAYLGVRLNSSVLRFFEDGKTTYEMVWETYPVVWLVLLLVVALAAVWWLFGRLLARAASRHEQQPFSRVRLALAIPLVLAIYFYGIVGKTGSVVPLRWSDAFFSDNEQVAALALNPAIFFFSTLNNESRPYDPRQLAAAYPVLADYLGVDQPDVKTFNLVRRVPGHAVSGRLPNIVFIHLESLGANRQSYYGSPLGATEHLEKIEKHGIFFPNFMVPSSGTARTVFGLVTGIPDVTWGGSTATRNPLISRQYTLVNAFRNYKKFYFIGGDAGWANVQGLLQHSIDGLELWQQGDYKAPVVDTWGISDLSLFEFANQRLNEVPEEQPFVAFIQLANNHRPFTMPKEDMEKLGFKWRDVDDATLHKYGFTDLPQYNAVRLQDRNLDHYLNELVPASHYANDTIFLMYGDHNTRSIEPSSLTNYSEPLGINHHHVPFVLYGPGIIKKPEVREQVATLMDVMPTALGFTGLPYENRTLGRDLMRWDKPGYALTFGGARVSSPSIGLLSQTDFLTMHYDGRDPRFYELAKPTVNVMKEHPEEVAERKQMLTGFYQMATYLLTHNAPDQGKSP